MKTDLTTLTDRELCDRVLHHDDQRAFETIVARHHSYVYGICMNRLRNETDTMDCVNQTFLKLYQYLPQFKWKCSLTTMLYWIASRKAGHCQQKNARREQAIGGPSLNDDLYLHDYGSRPKKLEEVVVDMDRLDWEAVNQLTTVVDEAIGVLKPRQRELLALRNTMDYNELAAALNMKVGTVKSGLARARDALVKAVVKKNPDMESYFATRARSSSVLAKKHP